MKKIASALKIAILSAVLILPLLARTESSKIEIPFIFTANGAEMPAGSYRVHSGLSRQSAVLVHIETGQRVQIMRQMGTGREGEVVHQLVFHEGGGKHVLAGIR